MRNRVGRERRSARRTEGHLERNWWFRKYKGKGKNRGSANAVEVERDGKGTKGELTSKSFGEMNVSERWRITDDGVYQTEKEKEKRDGQLRERNSKTRSSRSRRATRTCSEASSGSDVGIEGCLPAAFHDLLEHLLLLALVKERNGKRENERSAVAELLDA